MSGKKQGKPAKPTRKELAENRRYLTRLIRASREQDAHITSLEAAITYLVRRRAANDAQIAGLVHYLENAKLAPSGYRLTFGGLESDLAAACSRHSRTPAGHGEILNRAINRARDAGQEDD